LSSSSQSACRPVCLSHLECLPLCHLTVSCGLFFCLPVNYIRSVSCSVSVSRSPVSAAPAPSISFLSATTLPVYLSLYLHAVYNIYMCRFLYLPPPSLSTCIFFTMICLPYVFLPCSRLLVCRLYFFLTRACLFSCTYHLFVCCPLVCSHASFLSVASLSLSAYLFLYVCLSAGFVNVLFHHPTSLFPFTASTFCAFSSHLPQYLQDLKSERV
jgi:hypothetical protein